jgi:hypothetical protein
VTWQNLKYGWIALAGIAITGVTIFISDNERKQVEQIDIIELILGIEERCSAVGIDGLNYTKTIPTDSATTNTIVFTNALGEVNTYIITNLTTTNTVVTNALGWHIDRNLMIAMDSKIKTLIPYFSKTNSFESLTVTGLFATLNIGDGTNQFTATPEMIYNSRTNYVVDYVTYFTYPSAPTNIVYTSDVPVTVVYSTNVIVTTNLGVASTNFYWFTNTFNTPQIVSWTNPATYDDNTAWQIYTETLEERYKILNALEITFFGVPIEVSASAFDDDGYFPLYNGGYFSQLGVADNTVYSTNLNTDTVYYGANVDFVAIGRSGVQGVEWGTHSGGNYFTVEFDIGNKDNPGWVDFSLHLDVLSNSWFYISDFRYTGGQSNKNISASFNRNSLDAAATIYRPGDDGIAFFEFQLNPTFSNSFEYCTNRYW